MSKTTYRVIWIGADCRPFLSGHVTLEKAMSYLRSGEGHCAGLVVGNDWCKTTVDREAQTVALDVTKYGGPR